MKPLGKALKIAHREGKDKKKALDQFLSAYRATPHSATGLSPGDMLFRHGYGEGFPRGTVLEDSEVEEAQKRDQQCRAERDEKLNLSRSGQTPNVGDKIMTRNENKQRKFDPTFGPDWMTVTEVGDGGIRCKDDKGREQRRHLDDVKIATSKETKRQDIKDRRIENQKNEHENESSEKSRSKEEAVPRRSGRERRPNPRFNDYI